jgi:hypothetical protein
MSQMVDRNSPKLPMAEMSVSTYPIKPAASPERSLPDRVGPKRPCDPVRRSCAVTTAAVARSAPWRPAQAWGRAQHTSSGHRTCPYRRRLRRPRSTGCVAIEFAIRSIRSTPPHRTEDSDLGPDATSRPGWAHTRRSRARSTPRALPPDWHFKALDGGHVGRFSGWESECPMPFSKHQIDPAHTEAMRSAFQRVCDALLLKCDSDDPMTEIMAELVLNDLVDDGQDAPQL